MEWAQALTAANTLSHGSCGLTDGSVAGDWRLPNVRELHSLIDFEFDNPALSNAAGTAQWTEGDAFSGAEATARFSDFHWSSTTVALVGNPDFAWRVRLFDGVTVTNTKVGFTNRVWPVRGGE